MQGYLSRVTGSALSLAKKGAALINTVVASSAQTTQASESSTRPEAEFEGLFKSICSFLDQEANEPDSNSAEADSRLQAGGVRGALKKMTALLLADDENWLASQRSFNKDEDEPKTPVIDYLIHKNVIKQLCERAMNDLPRGAMPLLLTALSNLLRAVKYPLLPHQSVHKPISHLISVASRYEAVFVTHPRKTVAERERLASYKRRITIGLTALLRTVWRKVTEHPPIVDLFIITKRRASSSPERPSWSLTPQSAAKTHFDLLAALPPLLAEPRVSAFVLESLLIAFSISDPRIPAFLSEEARVWERLVDSLCEDLGEAVVMHSQPSASAGGEHCPQYLSVLVGPSSSAGKLFPSMDGTAQGGLPPAGAPSSSGDGPGPLRKLVKGLVVLRALQSAMRSRLHRLRTSSSGGEEHTAMRTCMDSLCRDFVDRFLLQALRPILETSNERTSTAAYTIVRVVLQTLALPSKEPFHDASRDIVASRPEQVPSLLGLTLRMLLLGPQAMDIYLQVGGATGRSTTTELEADPLLLLADAGAAVGSPERSGGATGTVTQTPGQQPSHLGADFVLVLLDRVGSRSKSLAQGAARLLATVLAMSPPLLALAHVQSLPCELACPPAMTAGPLEALRRRAVGGEDGSARVLHALTQSLDRAASALPLPPNARRAYEQAAGRHLACLVFHSAEGLISLPAAFFDRFLVGLAVSEGSQLSWREGSFLDKLLKRLQSMAQLSAPEQLLVSDLLQQALALLCVLLVLGGDAAVQKAALVAVTLLRKLEALLAEVTAAAGRQLGDLPRKWALARDFLQTEAEEFLALGPQRVELMLPANDRDREFARQQASPSPPSLSPAPKEEGTGAPKRSSFFSPVGKLLAGNLFDDAPASAAKQPVARRQPATTPVAASSPASSPAPIAATAATAATTTKPQARRQLEAETPQAKAMLATLLLLQEMVLEAQGLLLAACRLRRSVLSEAGGEGEGDGTGAEGSEGALEDGEERREEQREADEVRELLAVLRPKAFEARRRGHAPDLDMDSREAEFLQECRHLEALLDSLVSAA